MPAKAIVPVKEIRINTSIIFIDADGYFLFRKILPVVNAGTRSQTEVFINGIGGDVGDVFTAYWFYSKADGTAISDQAFESKTLT